MNATFRRAVPPLTALVLFAAPTAAQATTVSTDGATVRITESVPDERNEVIVKHEDGKVVVMETGSVDLGPGCQRPFEGADTVECAMGSGGVLVTVGGGNDFVSHVIGYPQTVPDGAVRVELGDGADKFSGVESGEVVDGGPGDDVLHGMEGPDTLAGGDGRDELIGHGGADVLRGDAGDDLLKPDQYEAAAPDVVDGGAGRDRLEDWWRSGDRPAPRADFSPDGVANDGRPSEGDNVVGVEDLDLATTGDVTGDDGPNVFRMRGETAATGSARGLGGADELRGGQERNDFDGGAGDDVVQGGSGDDRLLGGAGRDVIVGDGDAAYCAITWYVASCSSPFGNDSIDVRDGEQDSVDCGVGADTVVADAVDAVASNCETVDRGTGRSPSTPAVGPGGRPVPDAGSANGGRPVVDTGAAPGGLANTSTIRLTRRVSLRTALRRGVRLRLTGVRAGRATIVARAHGRTVASGRVTISRSGAGTVTLRFRRAAARSLARKRIVRLTVTGAGASTSLTLRR